MSQKYSHLQKYEKEIITLTEQGLTHRKVGERLGFSQKQIADFIKRYHKKQRKLAAGIEIKPKGRPRKDGTTGTALPPSIQQLSKVAQLEYELASKERQIKRLEMENELMRDFLSLTERK